jgi:hypothetical protein
MQTHDLHVLKGRDRVLQIRNELFVFPDVLEVFITGRPDVLVVVCAGRPRPAEWLRILRVAGYEGSPRRYASATRLEPDESCAERNGSRPTSPSESTTPQPREVRRRSPSRPSPRTRTTSITPCGGSTDASLRCSGELGAPFLRSTSYDGA